MPALGDITSQLGITGKGAATTASVLSVIGWFIFILIVASSIAFGIWWWWNYRQFNKKITVWEIVGNFFYPTREDTARIIKIGRGGYEVLYLKKSKVYRISYGSRIGINRYHFFIGADGYWYNGLVSNKLTKDGVAAVIVTNPLARAEYTALEHRIDALFGEKKSFMEKYGVWVFGTVYIAIMGIFVYMTFKEYSAIMGQMPGMLDKLGTLVDTVNKLLATQCNNNPNSGIYTKVG